MKRKNKFIIFVIAVVCSAVFGLSACKPDNGKHTHSYTESVTPPTCTEQGYTTHTCECGESYTDSYVPANGHTPKAAVRENEVEPTCRSDGEGGYDEVIRCSVCNETISSTHITTARLNHNIVDGVCSLCGYDTNMSEHSHVFRQEVTAPTCTAKGYTTYICNCGYSYNTDYVDMIDHTPAEAAIEVITPSTCTVEGSGEAVVNCSVCHAELSRTLTAVATAPHTYSDGICTVCDTLQTEGLEFSLLSDGTYRITGCKTTNELIVIPSKYKGVKVTAIAQSAFTNVGMKNIIIPDSVTSIGASAFRGCRNLTEITIPKGVKSISDSAFNGCSSLKSIVIPDGVTSIGDRAFNACDGLTSITIPAGVTSIGSYAFFYCGNLKSVNYKGTAESWNNISIGANNENLKNAARYYG